MASIVKVEGWREEARTQWCRRWAFINKTTTKTSQVTYVTIVPWEWERDTASSFEGCFGNTSSVTGYLKHDYKHPMHLSLAGGRLWRKLMSVCEHKRAPVIILNTSSSFFQGGPTGMPKAWRRDTVSRSHSQGTMVTYVTWDVPFRRELYTASSFEGHFGNAMPTPPCWGKSVQKLDS